MNDQYYEKDIKELVKKATKDLYPIYIQYQKDVSEGKLLFATPVKTFADFFDFVLSDVKKNKAIDFKIVQMQLLKTTYERLSKPQKGIFMGELREQANEYEAKKNSWFANLFKKGKEAMGMKKGGVVGKTKQKPPPKSRKICVGKPKLKTYKKA